MIVDGGKGAQWRWGAGTVACSSVTILSGRMSRESLSYHVTCLRQKNNTRNRGVVGFGVHTSGSLILLPLFSS